ncbi:MAG: glycosyltransferase [Maioricimonas sp. JB049]
MMISFVIPARNEEALLGATLAALATAAGDREHEVIVVNDASTDRTFDVARAHGARVIDVELHNIGAVRNAGAREARGEILYFLDADTLLPRETLDAALRALEQGAIGGGGRVRFDARITWYHWVFAELFILWWQRIRGWAAGCNIFVRREAFEKVGGFNENFFAAEERELTRDLRNVGRFVILREAVITSTRKLRMFSLPYILRLAARVLVLNPRRMQRREGLEFLYDAPREKPSDSRSR